MRSGNKMKNRTLFLHAGGSKSGSSAIQVFLSLNVERLRALGFRYRENQTPVTNEYQVTSGNGEDLFEELASTRSIGSTRRARIRERLLSHFDDENSKAICSNEQFSLLTYENWSELLQTANEEQIEVIICYYVRNLSTFLSSSYDQGLKRHGMSVNWKDFLSQVETWEHFEALERLVKAGKKADLRVLSYDACRKHLVKSFLQVLEIEKCFDAAILDQGNKRIVNRSLTNAERDILHTLNTATADQYSKKLSDGLLWATPNATPEPLACDEAAFAQLAKKFGPQIAWINENFFGGQDVVKIVSSEVEPQRLGISSHDEKVHAYKVAFEFLAEAAKTTRTATLNEIANRLLAVDWENAGNPAIPEDFDPFGYLLCNRDLLVSDIKPFRHYIDFGRQETRIWKVQ